LKHQLESRTLRDIKSVFEHSGLRYLELSYLAIADHCAAAASVRQEAERRRAMILEAAQTLGARHIKVITAGERTEVARLADAFAELCSQAAKCTDALLVYEFLPPVLDANMAKFQDAIALVQKVAQPNARLLLDTWQLTKAGLSPADMRIVPIGSIGWVELADGLIEASSSVAEEAVGDRRLPGEGEFDIGGYIDAWRARGYDGPWGVEVMSDALRRLPIEEQYRRAYETSRAQFAPGRSAQISPFEHSVQRR
jgi:sugar phosphate isomerase/epimerase